MQKSAETIIIESQKKEIDDLLQSLLHERQEKYAHLANCEAIIAHNDRLRAALKSIAETAQDGINGTRNPRQDALTMADMRDIAEKALAGK
jgi:hypothetical protein